MADIICDEITEPLERALLILDRLMDMDTHGIDSLLDDAYELINEVMIIRNEEVRGKSNDD